MRDPFTLRGVLFARSDQQAQICMDKMCGLLGLPILKADRCYLIVTPNTPNRGRGYLLPNRILMYDIARDSIPDEIWHAIIPCIQREVGEELNISYFCQVSQRTDLVTDHVFTVRRQDGIGPHSPELPCAHHGHKKGASHIEVECGRRADEHSARPIARGAQDTFR